MILVTLVLLGVISIAMLVVYSLLPDVLGAGHRKLAYLLGMFVMFFFVIYLGMPAPPARADAVGTISPSSGGGILAQKRRDYDLGETSLGGVDAASSTMNLVLLGMRGMAASELWQTANEQQKNKDWENYRATLNSIVKLQPYSVKVWNFQAWNLSYNVAAEWDSVADRFYWLKEGIKFLKKGIERNQKHPELYWYAGSFIGEKIGKADESRQYRAYFKGSPGYADPEPDPNDPEPDFRKRAKRWKYGYDQELNQHGEDNYLVARNWFELANARELAAQQEYGVPQFEHINAFHVFFSYPARSKISYADALLGEGTFGEVTRKAWADAFVDWTQSYGKFEWSTDGGKVHFENTDDEVKQLRAEALKATDSRTTKWHWINQLGGIVNYTYWRRRCKLESEENVDLLVPTNVEAGDEFAVKIRSSIIRYTAKSSEPAEVVRGLAEAWTEASNSEKTDTDSLAAKAEFGAVYAQVAETPAGAGEKPVPALKLTWSAVSVEHPPVVSVKNGGAKDEQKFERRIQSRAIVDAHKDLYDGERLAFAADYTAQDVLSEGLDKFQETLRLYPDFIHDDELTESLMIAILEWKDSRDNLDDPLDDTTDANHPLIQVWQMIRDKSEPIVLREIAALTDKLGDPQRYLEAEQELMKERSPLVIMMSIHARRLPEMREEVKRRLRTYATDKSRRKTP